MEGSISYINSYIDDKLLLHYNFKDDEDDEDPNMTKYGFEIFVNFLDYLKENDNISTFNSLVIENKNDIIKAYYMFGLKYGLKNLNNRLTQYDEKLKDSKNISNVKKENNKKNESNNIELANKFKSDKKLLENEFENELKTLLIQEKNNRNKDLLLLKKSVEEIHNDFYKGKNIIKQDIEENSD